MITHEKNWSGSWASSLPIWLPISLPSLLPSSLPISLILNQRPEELVTSSKPRSRRWIAIWIAYPDRRVCSEQAIGRLNWLKRHTHILQCGLESESNTASSNRAAYRKELSGKELGRLCVEQNVNTQDLLLVHRSTKKFEPKFEPKFGAQF